MHLERTGVRSFFDLRLAGQDREHDLDIDHRLLDLAIDQAHEIQRLIQLDHHRIDHDEIADGIGPGGNAVSAKHHRRGEANGENDCLSGIEHCERGVGFDAGDLVALH